VIDAYNELGRKPMSKESRDIAQLLLDNLAKDQEIEALRLEQAQSNAEMIDLVMAMLGGV